jgi:hypothetical protein
MSRAMNLRLSEAEIVAKCALLGVSISAIEPLPGGGTHLVCVTGKGADEIRLHLHDQVMDGQVKRFPFYRA